MFFRFKNSFAFLTLKKKTMSLFDEFSSNFILLHSPIICSRNLDHFEGHHWFVLWKENLSANLKFFNQIDSQNSTHYYRSEWWQKEELSSGKSF